MFSVKINHYYIYWLTKFMTKWFTIQRIYPQMSQAENVKMAFSHIIREKF